MSDLSDFLLARIAEDEAAAQEAILSIHGQTGEWVTFDGKEHLTSSVVFARQGVGGDRLGQACDTAMSWIGTPARDHIAHWDPARVLRECAAKRLIVQRYTDAHDGLNLFDGEEYDQVILPALALPYADHPNYRSEWRP